MEPSTKKSFLRSPMSDSLNLIASIVGILGFLTGINNIPSMIANARTWFSSNIPYWVSIPVFVLSLLFVYGIYFLMLCRIYKWLYRRDAIGERFSMLTVFVLSLLTFRNIFQPKVFLDRIVNNFEIAHERKFEGNIFALFFFMFFGVAISALIFQAFFDVPQILTLISDWTNQDANGGYIIELIVLVSLFFLYLLCITAQNIGLEESKRL